jgi:hypothetical protein
MSLYLSRWITDIQMPSADWNESNEPPVNDTPTVNDAPRKNFAGPFSLSQVQLDMKGPLRTSCRHHLANIAVIGRKKFRLVAPTGAGPIDERKSPRRSRGLQKGTPSCRCLPKQNFDPRGVASLHFGFGIRRMFWSGLRCGFSYSRPFGRLYQANNLVGYNVLTTKE